MLACFALLGTCLFSQGSYNERQFVQLLLQLQICFILFVKLSLLAATPAFELVRDRATNAQMFILFFMPQGYIHKCKTDGYMKHKINYKQHFVCKKPTKTTNHRSLAPFSHNINARNYCLSFGSWKIFSFKIINWTKKINSTVDYQLDQQNRLSVTDNQSNGIIERAEQWVANRILQAGNLQRNRQPNRHKRLRSRTAPCCFAVYASSCILFTDNCLGLCCKQM